MEATAEPNGKPTWRDLRESEDRMMTAVKEHEEEVRGRFERAHGYHKGENDSIKKDLDDLCGRVDNIESILDQLRGARNLLYFVVGTNLLMFSGFLYSIFMT